MRSSALAPVAAVTLAVAACGPSGSPDPFLACTATPAEPAIACTNAVQPTAAGTDQILLHVPSVQVGTKLSFEIPAALDVASLTIVEQAVRAPASVRVKFGTTVEAIENMAVPYAVTHGTTLIYSDNLAITNPDQREQLLAYVPAAGSGTGALVIPSTTGGLRLVGPTGLPKGTWTLQVADLAWQCACLDWGANPCTGGSTSSTYDVTVIARPLVGGAIPTAGTLDVVVYFATTSAGSGAALTAANASRDPDLTRMAKSLGTLFANAGITVRSVTYQDLPADVQAQYATGVDVSSVDPCSPLGQLLKYGAGGKTLNVFFVSSFKGGTTAAGKTIVGLDGAIPGPATIGGTVESGVVASTINLRAGTGSATCSGAFTAFCGADQTAYYIAHEAGHFLGLSHPTELYGYRFDALADTNRCPCSACKSSAATDVCASGDGDLSDASKTFHTMTVTECTKSTSCGGGDNLMFWTLSAATSKGAVTGEQTRVMLANPLVQ